MHIIILVKIMNLYIVGATGLVGRKLIEILNDSSLEFEEMYIQCMTARESGHFATAIKKYNNLSYEVLEDGYVRYCLDLSSYNKSIKYFRLWTGQKLQMMDVEAVHIRDVYFGD